MLGFSRWDCGWFHYAPVSWLHEFYHEGERVAAYLVTLAAKLAVRVSATVVDRKARSPPI